MFKYLFSGWVLIALLISPAHASTEKMGNFFSSDESAFALKGINSPEPDMRMAQVSGVPGQPPPRQPHPNKAIKRHNRKVKKQIRRQAIGHAVGHALAPHAVPGVTPPLPYLQPNMGHLPGHLYGPPAPVPGVPYQLYALPYHRTLPVLRDNPYHCTQIIGWSNSGMTPPGWPPDVFYSEVDYCRRVYYVAPAQGVPAPPPPAAVPSPPPPPSQYSADDLACRDLATRAAGNAADRTAGGALMGGLFGAATGAAIGAAAGDPASGAAIGGAVGATSGAARGNYEANADYQRAYQNCMRSRGH